MGNVIFFFKQKTAYEMLRSLVGSEMCIRDSAWRALSNPSGCLLIPLNRITNPCLKKLNSSTCREKRLLSEVLLIQWNTLRPKRMTFLIWTRA